MITSEIKNETESRAPHVRNGSNHTLLSPKLSLATTKWGRRKRGSFQISTAENITNTANNTRISNSILNETGETHLSRGVAKDSFLSSNVLSPQWPLPPLHTHLHHQQ